MIYSFTYIHSPVGRLKLVANENALVAILWEKEALNRVRLADLYENPQHAVLVQTSQQLQAYFRGELQVFDLPIMFLGTAFQKAVWSALLTIPYGQLRTYKQIAEQIGNVKAIRAVGAANGKNPLSIVVPCHRVIGSNGTLTGFAGGLKNKQTLLDLESLNSFNLV